MSGKLNLANIRPVIFCTRTVTKRILLYDSLHQFNATAEIHSLAGQDPYFGITGDYYEIHANGARKFDGGEGGGSCHELIAEHFPEFAPFLKWHLTSVNHGPMHYLANGLYWLKNPGQYPLYEKAPLAERQPVSRAAFERTIVLGVVPGDAYFWSTYDQIPYQFNDGYGTVREDFSKRQAYAKQFLIDRFPALMEQFDISMRALFGGDYHFESGSSRNVA